MIKKKGTYKDKFLSLSVKQLNQNGRATRNEVCAMEWGRVLGTISISHETLRSWELYIKLQLRNLTLNYRCP